jgi:putative ABC transport system permease protein
VVGAGAARQTGLGIGRRFTGTHGTGTNGHDHDHFTLTVVGILVPTGTITDRLILTTVDSVWAMHGIEAPGTAKARAAPDHAGDLDHDHDDHAKPAGNPAAAGGAILDPRGGPAPDIRAILVTYRNAMASVRLPSAINRETALQSASTATETARLLNLFGAALDGARLFAWLVAFTGLASVFVILLSVATTREGDMALLRVMGASRAQAAGTVLLEGLIIAASRVLLGLAAAHALLGVGAALLPTLGAVGVTPSLFHPGELAIGAAVLGLGVLAALVPAIKVYATDLADTLARAT